MKGVIKVGRPTHAISHAREPLPNWLEFDVIQVENYEIEMLS
jgi:hypothetical protein